MSKQVFQTDNKSRWRSFKWSFRIIIFVFLLLFAIFLTTLFIDKYPSIPLKPDYKSAVTATKPFMQETKISREYKGFRDKIHEQKIHSDYEKIKKNRMVKDSIRNKKILENVKNRQLGMWQEFPSGIRSAFYVSWDPQSFYSLKRNAKSLNLVMPEWFFINPQNYSIKTTIDRRGITVMRKNGVPIMPMLSNNVNKVFRSDIVHKILQSPVRRQILIQQSLDLCVNNKFVGINIDFEEVPKADNQLLIQFVREMSAAFHAKGLLVSQDIVPLNNDFDVRELGKNLDYVCLMAYDEYSLGNPDAGPVSSQKWIEESVDDW